MLPILTIHNIKGLFFTLTALFFLWSCKPSSQIAINQPPTGKRYAIGQGGGFTGVYTEFILSENGKVHKYDFNYDREVFFKDLNEADLVYFLEQLDDLGLEGIEMNKPGNITKYIEVRDGNISINKIVWGHPNHQPNEDLTKLHKALFETLSTWD